MVDILDDGIIPANLGYFDYKGLYKVVCTYLDKTILNTNIVFSSPLTWLSGYGNSPCHSTSRRSPQGEHIHMFSLSRMTYLCELY